MSVHPDRPRALPGVAIEILESVYQHRLLTTRQIQALHAPCTSIRWTQQTLSRLRARGLLDRATTEHGLGLWFISVHGADTVDALATRVETRRRVSSPEQALGPLRAHTLAVNDTGIAFVTAARERGDDCGPLSWRHEIAHPLAPRARHANQLVITDALLSYLEVTQDSLILHQRFIELDRGTIPPGHLAEKLARYTHLHDYTPKGVGTSGGPLWRSRYRAFPGVLVVLANQTHTATRRRIERVLALAQPDDRHTVAVSFVSLDDLTARGPFAASFISAAHPERYVDWLDQPQQER